MKLGLTIKQKNMKDTIREFIRQHEYSPSFRELAELTNTPMKSITNVHRLIHQLEERGHLYMRAGNERSITLIDD